MDSRLAPKRCAMLLIYLTSDEWKQHKEQETKVMTKGEMLKELVQQAEQMKYERENKIPTEIRVYDYESLGSRSAVWKSMTYVSIQDPIEAANMETTKTYQLTMGTFSCQLYRKDVQ
jgi:hypothetical protein